MGDVRAGFDRAVKILQDASACDDLPAAVLRIDSDHGETHTWHGGDATDSEVIFLIASITKPIVCTAASLLLERGLPDLDDRAAFYLPEFGQRDTFDIRVRHLFTHTSGLHDFLQAELFEPLGWNRPRWAGTTIWPNA